MVELETSRLLLREIVESDLPDIHEYGSNPEVCRYTLWGPNTLEESNNFIENSIKEQLVKPRKNIGLGIILKSENKLVGGCGFTNISSHKASIGYVLNRNYWGKGIATEAAKALVSFGFTTLKLHRIFALVFPDNIASSNVLVKTGMTLEGRLRDEYVKHGVFHDSLVYGILFHEWVQ